MKSSQWTDPQFVDATGTGGLNAAFNTVSGSIAGLGSGIWALPGLISPESMTLNFTNLVGSVSLPAPWSIVNTSGVVVHAHGTQTGQDTTSYSVDFTSLVPSSGSVTAFLAATINQIQQNPFPLTGPPQGHPSFNPNFVPTTAYATTVYSVALSAVTGGIDNVSIFELARTTLTPSQTGVASYSTFGWRRAATLTPVPALTVASGGVLTLAQATALIMPAASGLTSTLPLAVSGGGLSYRLANPSPTASWTIAASTNNTLVGGTAAAVNSLVVPPYGAVTLWGNAASGTWEIIGANPLIMASLANVYTAPQTILDNSVGALTLVGTATNGVNLKLTGNGSTTPSKTLRVVNGAFGIVNSAYTINLLSLDDSGNLGVVGSIAGQSLSTVGAATIGNGLVVSGGGVYSAGYDSGGMQFRLTSGASAAAGFRNDGTSFYILMSNTGAPTGGFNGLRPLTISLTTGAMTIDSTGAGVVFGGNVSTPYINATTASIGGVAFPGGGAITAPGAINSSSSIIGATVQAAGNITSTGGRLRASLGAVNSGDPNAGVILSDFYRSVGGSPFESYIYWKSPDGTIIQAYTGTSVTGGDPITFPNAFPNMCVEVLAGEGAPTGWVNGTQPTVFGTQQLTAGGFALFVVKWNLSAWALAPGITYRYIAIGF